MIFLEKPSNRHRCEFLDAVRRSRSLHKGLVAPPRTEDRFQQYLSGLRRKNQTGFLVVVENTKEIAGVVNVSEIVGGGFQSAYLGYYAFLPHAGRGLMKQGLRQVIRFCFKELKLHRLEANIQPQNERSIALVRSLGFMNEGYSPRYLKVCGRWRDHERWAILSENWR